MEQIIIKILIANKNKSFRELQKEIFLKSPHIQVIDEASSFTGLIKKLQTVQPDILFMADEMPGGDALEILLTLKDTYPNLKIITTTKKYDEDYINYLLKKSEGVLVGGEQTDEEFINAIEQVYAGETDFISGLDFGNISFRPPEGTDRETFETDLQKLSAMLGINFFENAEPSEFINENKEAKYLEETIRPTIEDYLQHCTEANEAYQYLKENPPERDLDIIDWRAKYLALNDFCLDQEQVQNSETLLFLNSFSESPEYFIELVARDE